MERKAQAFAASHHADQRRKCTGEPYINHLAAVVELVRSVPHTVEMLCAAWLHDVVEDTSATLEDVHREFGAEVAALVSMLTDVSVPSDGNRATRKALDRAHLATASAEAQTVKLADVIDNVRNLNTQHTSFVQVYLPEKVLVLGVLQKGDAMLMANARDLLSRWYLRDV